MVYFNCFKMADLDVNAVALNLTNTLSPEANVRRQGSVGFMSPLNLRFLLVLSPVKLSEGINSLF